MNRAISVLIVEDDPMVADINCRYLAEVEGFHLTGIAKTGAEAVSFLDREDVKLVLLDIYLPGMNGLEFLTEIRRRQKPTDVIVVSAAREPDIISQALRHGAVDYLVKPFEFDRLAASLRAYRERIAVIESASRLDQATLDREVLRKAPVAAETMPKGLDKNTFKLVCDAVQARQGSFSTEEIASQVGLSRVSMRKYLKFLEELGAVKVEIIHGSVGRPLYCYRCIKGLDAFPLSPLPDDQ